MGSASFLVSHVARYIWSKFRNISGAYLENVLVCCVLHKSHPRKERRHYIRGKNFGVTKSKAGIFVDLDAMDESDSNSFCSFDSSDGTDSSNSNSNSSSWNNLSEAHDGPLFHMNTLAATLPCKRGLSNFYGGKSQSFSCVADVKCVEELAKPEDSYYRKKKLKSFQSCGSKLNISLISSASMIAKRPQKASKMMASKSAMNFVMSSMPPVSPPKHIS